ncbi:MAG TPA: two-component regulator propeller domain-containing protein, partial [Longimicrobiaceae bacterium]|nr:two-component regulator propeller domain-containing protein [Longimicrobiaceae bacterium]
MRSFAQGADGVLWISSDRGLFHFDGVRFERYEPPPGQTLPPQGTHTLLALPDTSLWIGHVPSGMSVLHRGRIVTYGTRDGLPDAPVTAIARDSAGVMWASTMRGLARFDGRRWEVMGPSAGYPGGVTAPVLVDRRGAVWAGNFLGFYVLPRGAARFEKREVKVAGQPVTGYLMAGPDGSLWGSAPSFGLFLIADPSGRPPPPGTPPSGHQGLSMLLAIDRDRPAVAFGPAGGRLLRVWLPGTAGGPGAPAGRPRSAAIPFSRAAGMSGDIVTAALYDREGTLWVGTATGVDRFRETKLTPVVWPGPVQWPAVVADTGGTVWAGVLLGTPSGLFSIGDRVVPQPGSPPELIALHRDFQGGFWVGGTNGLWQRRGEAFAPVPLPPPSPMLDPGQSVYAIARDRGGRLWVSLGREGVYSRSAGGAWKRFGVEQGLGDAPATTLIADSSGRTWLGYLGGQVALVAGDSVRVLAAAEGVDVASVLAITVRGDRVWIGGQSGLVALDPRAARTRFVALRTAGEPLRGISGVVETTDGELWLNGVDGVTRIPAGEVRRALSEPGYRARFERFDHRDGIDPPAPQVRPLPSAVAGTDGRIWFTGAGGLSWVDPRRVRRNAVPPPVQLRTLTAGGRRHLLGSGAGDTLRLAPRTTALSVAYTAYSLAVPERVRFRYRLEGFDTAWQDAGGRREAFYTNL